MKLGVVAGEYSGDLLGASMMKALREVDFERPDVDFTASGIGGPAMFGEGCVSLYDIENLSVMGFFEPLLRLPKLIKIRRGLIKHFLENPPDVFVGIDSPDFNLGLEQILRNAKIPTVHYVSPSVWAWREKRIHKIAKAVDLMLTLFPFEEEFYKKHNVPVRCVGHPLADQIPVVSDKLPARVRLGLDPHKIYVALLPGSRRNEIKYLGELFISTAYRLWKVRPQIEFITSSINEARHKEFQNKWRHTLADVPIKFFHTRAHDVIQASDIVLVGSGTATLETMLFKRPMVIAYRMGALTYQIAKRVVKTPFIGLPNLLAKEKVVPEFIQKDATPDKLTAALLEYLDHPEKVFELEKKFTELHLQLKRNASQQAANAILELVKGK